MKNIGVKKKNKHIILLWDQLIDIKMQNIEIKNKNHFNMVPLAKYFKVLVQYILEFNKVKWAIEIIFQKLELHVT